ncbi:MAG: TRAP transporter small permease [Rhodobacterales bacterium]|nr:TRAP transporter small permease [Rhodobacterales bacterium]
MQDHSRWRLLLWLDQAISMLEALIVGLSVTVMAINTIANVFGRYVFSQSLYFSEEVNEIAMVTITFIGLGYVTRKGLHIRMSALYDMVPDAPRRLLMALIALLSAAAMFLLAWYAWEYVDKVAGRGRITPAMQLPLWITYVAVVIGFFLAGVQYVATVIVNLTRSDEVWISHCHTDGYEDPELATMMELQKLDGPPANTRPANAGKE